MCELEADGDGTLLSHTTPRARKPHRCDECGWTIAKGERYERTTSLWEGSICTAVECLGCAAWRTAFDAAHEKVEGYVCSLQLGGLWQSIAEFTHEYLGYSPDVDWDDDGETVHWPIDPRLATPEPR